MKMLSIAKNKLHNTLITRYIIAEIVGEMCPHESWEWW